MHNPPQNINFNVTVTFSNVAFSGNVIETIGSCLYANTYSNKDSGLKPLIIVLKDVIAYRNKQDGSSTSISKAGMFTMDNIKALHITGSSSHYHDNSGLVFEVIDTH